MSGYVLSPRAQADIDEIWDYTAERWDAEQAERYSRELQQAIETVASDPERGRRCDQIRPGYRKYPAGAHVISFFESSEVESMWFVSCTNVWTSNAIYCDRRPTKVTE